MLLRLCLPFVLIFISFTLVRAYVLGESLVPASIATLPGKVSGLWSQLFSSEKTIGDEETFYKWTDSSGTVHFTRENPADPGKPGLQTEQDIEVQAVRVDPNANILQTPEPIIEDDPVANVEPTPQKKSPSLLIPGGAMELMEDARNVEKVLEERDRSLQNY